MDEVFGYRPDRPDHPDFWRLTAVVMGLDIAVEAGEDVNHTRLGKAVDLASVRYMARQRAMRARALTAKPFPGWSPLRALTAVYLDGFLCGYLLGAQGVPQFGMPDGPL